MGNLFRIVLRTLAVLVGLLVTMSVGLIVLSELGEVVVIHTELEDGSVRTTRIWIVDADEGPLVRGTAGKPWVDGIRRQPRVEVERAGERRTWVAVEQPDVEARRHADRLMREKYGIADSAIGLLRDFDTSVCFRLTEPGTEPGT